jgi:hypothetical protein
MPDRLYDSAAAFEKALMDAAEQFETEVSVTVRKSLVDLTSAIIQDTPRDTGRAAAGWNLTAGRPGDDVPPEGRESYTVQDPNDPGDAENMIWYVVNNVEYIEPLEDGHSDQAPQGMMAVNLQRYARILQNAADQSEMLE